MGTINILDPKAGDIELKWDSTHRSEVEAAKKTFDDLVKKGFMAYSFGAKGQKNMIHEFDSEAERIILAQPRAPG